MKQAIFKILTCIAVFFGALYVFGFQVHNDSTEMTAEMSSASLPLISFQSGGYYINTLHGYAQRMESEYLRDSITPLDDDRQLYLRVEKFDTAVSGITYEVRSLDSSRLIEKTEVKNYQETTGYITATLPIKDLIETDEEYTFIVILKLGDGREIYYYTRIIYGSSLHLYSKLNFVVDFHETTFDKENIDSLKTYMESNKSGDNTTLARVDIHSSLDQLGYASLAPERITDPQVMIREMQSQTASFELSFLISVKEGKEETIYRVNEYYRIRYGTERCYLLDYVRTMDKLSCDVSELSDSRISLGIVNEEIQLKETEDGNVFAFVVSDSLYSYNVKDNKYATIFSFWDGDERNAYNAHNVRLLSIDENGNVTYMVYGYMNRGRHEGQIGVAVGYYNAALNRNEEKLFLPYTRSYSQLKSNVERLASVNDDGIFYLYLDGTIYDFQLDDCTAGILKTDLSENSFRVSDDFGVLVLQSGDDPYRCKELVLMDLWENTQKTISAGDGNRIAPIGFMGRDLIYGLAREEDIQSDANGNVTFPMYILYIRDEAGQLLKTYSEDDVYVVGGSIDNNLLTLERVVKKQNGQYIATYSDQIKNNSKVSAGNNVLSQSVSEKYETENYITMKKSISVKSVKTLSPKELLSEEKKTPTLPEGTVQYPYYVYARDGIIGTFLQPSQAIRLADANAGVVTDSYGNYVWYRANRATRNQIMKITAYECRESQTSLEGCMDAILLYNGAELPTSYDFENHTIGSVLCENVPLLTSLDLTGCTLDEVLYYVNRDIPVLALTDDDRYVLITGFNTSQIVILDPVSGTLAKKDTDTMEERFENAGNVFFTYIPTAESMIK